MSSFLSISAACRIDPQPNAFHQPNGLFFAVGENVVVRCRPGYEKSQDGNLTCQDDGNWNKNFPRCTGKLKRNGEYFIRTHKVNVMCESRIKDGAY